MISVIVPVYNVADYLDRCIESIINQTYSDLEVILVNDGSTDNSYEICKKYERTDSRVKVISQNNQGVSVARNNALEIAAGDWISFVDSDDYLDLDFYELLICGSKKTNSEVVCCGVRPVNDQGIEVPHLITNKIPVSEVKLDMNSVFYHFFDLSERYIYWSPFDKIFRADIVKTLRFEPGRKRAEDFFFCFSAFLKCSSVYYLPQKRYNYFQRPNSVTHTKKFDESSFDPTYFSKKALDILIAMNAQRDVIGWSRLHYAMLSAKVIKAFYLNGDKKNRQYCEKIALIRKDLKAQCFLFRKLSSRYFVLCCLAAFIPRVFSFIKR